MTADLVLDSSVLIASLLPPDRKRSPQPQDADWYARAFPYIEGLSNGEYRLHLPRLCVIEVCAQIRRISRRGQVEARGAERYFALWEQHGAVRLYDLDQGRMQSAIDMAVRTGLKGADAIFCALAEELGCTLKAFDGDVLDRYANAETP